MGFGPHVLAVFCFGLWNAWWVDCRAVLSPGSSGCWWLQFPSCHLSQFLTPSPSPSAHWELRAPPFGLAAACFPAYLDCFFLRTPALWLSVSLEQRLQIVSRGFASRGHGILRLAMKQTCHIDFLLCQKLKKQEWCLLKNKNKQTAAATTKTQNYVGTGNLPAILYDGTKGQLTWKQQPCNESWESCWSEMIFFKNLSSAWL